MALNDVNLNNSVRGNLITLGNVKKMLGRTENRLSSGLKVDSALDGPVPYFMSQGFKARANDLASLKDSMSVAIRNLEATDNGITQITSVVQQMQGLITAARQTSDTTARSAYATQFGALATQIDNLVKDSGFNGTNLLNGTGVTLAVTFNETSTTKLDIVSVNHTAASLGGGITTATSSWASDANIDTDSSKLQTALNTLRTDAKKFGDNSTLLTTRINFTDNLNNALIGASGDLTNANVDEEGANANSLTTRQQLGFVALSIDNQAQQGVLRLF